MKVQSEGGDRFEIDELSTEFFLLGTRLIVVEGETDCSFFSAWLGNQECELDYEIRSVDWIEVPDDLLESQKLVVGNRSRVLMLGRRLRDVEGVRCIADRDAGYLVEKFETESTILFTDFPAIESYILEQSSYENLNSVALSGKLPDYADFVDMAAPVFSGLYDLRRSDPAIQLGKSYSKWFKNAATLEGFDHEKAPVDKRALCDIALTPRSNNDIMHYAYGHDIAEIMLLVSKSIRKKFGSLNCEALESMFRLTLLGSGELGEYPMFASLLAWLNPRSVASGVDAD